MNGPIIALAAGGTGGHLFPAKALASALLTRGPRPVLVTDARGEAFEIAGHDLPVHRIAAKSPSGGWLRRLTGGGALALGVFQARVLLARLAPAAVVGFGGFASVPTVVAARWLGLPVVLHEQNAVLGRANRLLARYATTIATSFDETAGVPAGDQAKTRAIGNPVRDEIATLRDSAYSPPTGDRPVHLLITGGSQGARVFADILPPALAALPAALRARLRVAQQARQEDVARVTAAYRTSGIDAEVSSFFGDMARRLAAAHLLICRAGASTMAEIAAAGRPAVLVPYPHAMDDHQSANARAAADTGAAWLLAEGPLTVDDFRACLERALGDPAGLAAAAAAARRLDHPGAAEALVDLLPITGEEAQP